MGNDDCGWKFVAIFKLKSKFSNAQGFYNGTYHKPERNQ